MNGKINSSRDITSARTERVQPAEEIPIPPYLPDTPAVRGKIAGYYTDIDILDRELGHAMNLLTRSGKQDNTFFMDMLGRNYKEMGTEAWTERKAKARTDADVSRLLGRMMNRPVEELYDLAQDPWELANLTSAPSHSHAEAKARLRRDLDRWMKQQGDLGMAAESAVKPHKSMQTAQ